MARSKVAASKQRKQTQLITAAVAFRLPSLANQVDLLDWLVQDVLASEGSAAWASADTLQGIIGQFLLDWEVCGAELEVSLACEDLLDSYSQPSEPVLKVAAALQQGQGLQQAIDSCNSVEEDQSDEAGLCMLCKRDLPLTLHHLFPKETHAKFVKRGLMSEADRLLRVSICRQCHNTVHRTFSNEELSTSYHSLDSLEQHPAIQRWLTFASKQKPRNMQHGMKTAR